MTRRRAAGFLVLALGGAGAFAAGLSGPDAPRLWQAYLVNFLFWTGLAAGAVLLSAVLTLTGARWASPAKRPAEAFAAFLPVACLLFAGLWFGREALFPALAEAPEARRLWLAPGFLFPRDGLALLALAAAAAALSRRRGRSTPAAVAYALLYAVTLSLLGFDWIMFLDPHWLSTLFGAYYFVGSFYGGLAAVAVVAGTSAAGRRLGEAGCRDLGTLLLGFAFTTGYLFYVQFLVIWFGNVPTETAFLMRRLRDDPWAPLSWAVLVVGFGLPVAVLLFRRAKARPGVLAAVGGLSLGGLWLERFLLVAPSLTRRGPLPLGLPELLVTAGFLGLTGLSVLAALRAPPPAGAEP